MKLRDFAPGTFIFENFWLHAFLDPSGPPAGKVAALPDPRHRLGERDINMNTGAMPPEEGGENIHMHLRVITL